MSVNYTICCLSKFMIMGVYCVNKVHNMLPWWYYDIGSILCRKGTQYATFSAFRSWEQIKQFRYTICYLSSIKIMGAYCVGWVHNMLP